jgi:hypothetical protein
VVDRIGRLSGLVDYFTRRLVMEIETNAFPVAAVNNRVYTRTRFLLCTARNDEQAREIAMRLNFSDICGFGREPRAADAEDQPHDQ